MNRARCNPAVTMTLILAAILLPSRAWPQAAVPPPAHEGVELDRVAAVVNGDLILESDIDEERRLEAFQPFRTPTETTRDKIVERLVDRTLILQQARLQPEPPITEEAVDEQIASLRKGIQGCKEYHCDTDEGWSKFVAAQGFTMDELRRQWKLRMEVLRFIEERFRTGVRVQDDEVKAYYEKTLLPEYVRRHATAPPLEAIAPRIEEILVQQRVTGLLTDWLKALRAQGQVRILPSAEVTP